jgi:hypothetical protein
LLKVVIRAAREGWNVSKSKVKVEMADVLYQVAMTADNPKVKADAAKALLTLMNRDQMERARLALDAEKFSAQRAASSGPDLSNLKLIDIEVTRVKARLNELKDPSLGRALVPGLPTFTVKDVEVVEAAK